MTTFNLHQLGIDALDIMEMRGWCRGAMFALSGKVCATGALWLATGRDEEEGLAVSEPGSQAIYDWDMQRLAPVLDEHINLGNRAEVWAWNDHNGWDVVRETLANLPDVDVEL